jgi:urease accessory protein
VIASLWFVVPATAGAHLAVKGIGEIGNGALHPLITPAHVLILLGLGLLLGQRIPFELKSPMLVLSASSAIALALTATGWILEVPSPFLISLALAIGALVAVGKCPHRQVTMWICALAAIGIGLDSGLEDSPPVAMAKTLAGTWIAINAVTGYVALAASNGAEKEWARTGVRVLGSWIFAIALLVLAFALKK